MLLAGDVEQLCALHVGCRAQVVDDLVRYGFFVDEPTAVGLARVDRRFESCQHRLRVPRTRRSDASDQIGTGGIAEPLDDDAVARGRHRNARVDHCASATHQQLSTARVEHRQPTRPVGHDVEAAVADDEAPRLRVVHRRCTRRADGSTTQRSGQVCIGGGHGHRSFLAGRRSSLEPFSPAWSFDSRADRDLGHRRSALVTPVPLRSGGAGLAGDPNVARRHRSPPA